ncbi:MAG: L-histidine N(alpha)-methyltransferase [Nitrococcus mobilis]|nr:L-histidine N(alpha)-methyltransferase [Nitrococcus mobilis]
MVAYEEKTLLKERFFMNISLEGASVRSRMLERFECQTVPAARAVPNLAEDVLQGFARRPRALPPKYFYDALGSELFDRICDTPEYYPTRTEARLLDQSAHSIIRQARPDHIIELGSGTSRKTAHLLEACEANGLEPSYWPFDVCEAVLHAAAEALLEAHPWLKVQALIGDYSAGLAHLPQPAGRRLFVFLGGTIGNLTPEESIAFLSELRGLMREGDAFLLGADRTKAPRLLQAAYDDARGLTAEFNRNVLNVINQALRGDFDPYAFDHLALYNETLQRIEMYLVARHDQEVHLMALERRYGFLQGERILTEISRKFTAESLTAELRAARLNPTHHYQTEDRYFSLVLARPN